MTVSAESRQGSMFCSCATVDAMDCLCREVMLEGVYPQDKRSSLATSILKIYERRLLHDSEQYSASLSLVPSDGAQGMGYEREFESVMTSVSACTRERKGSKEVSLSIKKVVVEFLENVVEHNHNRFTLEDALYGLVVLTKEAHFHFNNGWKLSWKDRNGVVLGEAEELTSFFAKPEALPERSPTLVPTNAVEASFLATNPELVV